MTDNAHRDRQLFLSHQHTHAYKLARSIQWLREREIYRGDVRCQHRYVPAMPLLAADQYR